MKMGVEMGIEMERLEHLNWCKQRARAYIDQGKPSLAIASMLSDLSKHAETAIHISELESIGFYSIKSIESAREFIEKFE